MTEPRFVDCATSHTHTHTHTHMSARSCLMLALEQKPQISVPRLMLEVCRVNSRKAEFLRVHKLLSQHFFVHGNPLALLALLKTNMDPEREHLEGRLQVPCVGG